MSDREKEHQPGHEEAVPEPHRQAHRDAQAAAPAASQGLPDGDGAQPSDEADAEVASRLGRLRDATDSISAHPQFTARLMARLELERPGWLRVIPGLWQKALPVAMLLAMMSAVWAYHTTRTADAGYVIAIANDSDYSAEIDW